MNVNARQVVDMYNGTKIGAVGMTTSGGTESIIMCVRAHVEWGRGMKGISEPHMVLPTTAHPAFDKAAQAFGVRITRLPLHHRSHQADVRKLSGALTPSTVLVVGSAPGYPHGIIDDIAAMAAIAEAAGVGFHVDCCLGGFVVPFMAEAGYPIDPVDFRVSGVTSISCDTHKYGFAPKGSSVRASPELSPFFDSNRLPCSALRSSAAFPTSRQLSGPVASTRPPPSSAAAPAPRWRAAGRRSCRRGARVTSKPCALSLRSSAQCRAL